MGRKNQGFGRIGISETSVMPYKCGGFESAGIKRVKVKKGNDPARAG